MKDTYKERGIRMSKDKGTSENFHYNNIEKKDKNFMYKNFKRSNCYNCNFMNSKFDFASFRGAHFKTCSFIKGSFEGTEFIGTNLKNSKFKNAKFKNAIFEGANLDGADFKDATFENTIFLGCKLEKAKNFNAQIKGVRIFEEMPPLEISGELENAINKAMENKHVKKSRTLDTKDGTINSISVMILLEKFRERRLIEGLSILGEKVDRDFCTLSYIIKSLQGYMDKGIL